MPTASGDFETDSVVEVEFQVEDRRYPLVAIPARAGCRTQVEQIVPQGDDTYTIFHRFTGADPERVRSLVNEYDGLQAELLAVADDGGTAKVHVSNPRDHFVVTLTDAGAIPRYLWSEDGTAHITAEVPGTYSVGAVVERFRETHPSATVAAKRQRDHEVPLFTRREFQDAIEALLTCRQREVLATAYTAGYYASPRETTGEQVAADLDISPATFSQHLRRAEYKILSVLFDDRLLEP